MGKGDYRQGCYCSVAKLCPILWNPITAAQHASLSFTVSQNLLNSCPLSQWCHLTISSSAIPSPPALSLSQHQGLFQWVSSSHQVTKVLELQLQHRSLQCIFRVDFLLDWLIWSPCSPRNSQESSSAPQFETINSSVLSLLYGPALTSLGDFWKVVFLKIRLSEAPPSLWMSTSLTVDEQLKLPPESRTNSKC